MRVIKYYDGINKKYVNVEVSDEVAKFLHASEKRELRQKYNDINYIAFSLDEKIDKSKASSLSYHEIIEDEYSNIGRIMENDELSRTIWNVVYKLEPMKSDFIIFHYVCRKRLTFLAEHFQKESSGNMTKWKSTILDDLKHLFCNDEEFTKTNWFYYNVIKPNKEETEPIVNNMLKDDSFLIDFNSVGRLLNQISQAEKKLTILDSPHKNTHWNMVNFMKMLVRPVVKKEIKEETKPLSIENLKSHLLNSAIQCISGNKNLKADEYITKKFDEVLSKLGLDEILKHIK